MRKQEGEEDTKHCLPIQKENLREGGIPDIIV